MVRAKFELIGGILDHLYFRLLMALLFFVTFFFITWPKILGLPKNIFINNLLLGISTISLILFLTSVLLLRRTSVPIYERQKFMDNDLTRYIQKSSENVKIVNVLFTWFDHIDKIIYKKIIKDNLKFEILLTRRKRREHEISYLTLREQDEYRLHQLVVVSNKTLFDIFLFLLKLAKCKTNLIQNFQVKEYDFMPVLTMYIFDDKKIIFGPYIAKNCSEIPLFQLENNIETIIKNPTRDILDAYNELTEHYDILSGRIRRPNKKYIPEFSFFDGKKDQLIHQFILNNLDDLIKLLEDYNRQGEYYDYLAGINNKFDDKPLEYLGKDKFEGRFDALMRHINETISNKII